MPAALVAVSHTVTGDILKLSTLVSTNVNPSQSVPLHDRPEWAILRHHAGRVVLMDGRPEAGGSGCGHFRWYNVTAWLMTVEEEYSDAGICAHQRAARKGPRRC
jgi:hypothetical protein